MSSFQIICLMCRILPLHYKVLQLCWNYNFLTITYVLFSSRFSFPTSIVSPQACFAHDSTHYNRLATTPRLCAACHGGLFSFQFWLYQSFTNETSDHDKPPMAFILVMIYWVFSTEFGKTVAVKRWVLKCWHVPVVARRERHDTLKYSNFERRCLDSFALFF